jgi:hypothetical protein
MGKKKTRFTIRCGGEDRLLLSVKELRDKSLLIVPKRARFARNAQLNRAGFAEVHYSVHNSPNSPGNTLKQTTILTNGERHTVTQNWIGLGSGTYSELFAQARTRLDIPHYTYLPKPTDRVVRLGSYDATRTVLVYTAILSAAGQALEVMDNRLHVAFADFELYRLSLLYSLLGMPSSEDGALSGFGKTGDDAGGVTPHWGDTSEGVANRHRETKNLMRQELLACMDHLSRCELAPEQAIKRDD